MTAQVLHKPETVTPEVLFQRARALAPILKERSALATAEGRIPTETIADMHEAGLFRVLQPRRYGGFEMHPNVFFQIQMILGEACMSTSWVYGVIGVHPWQMAMFDPKAQEEVWGDDTSTLIASTYMPVGKVTVVDGGFKLSGRWSFSSGTEHCGWIFLGGLVMPGAEGQMPEYRTFLLPQSDFKIVKNWDVIGLRATGSHDIVVEDAFVPEYRTHKTRDDTRASRPGLAINPNPLFTLPFMQVFARAVSTACVGGLQGAINEFRKIAAVNVSRNFLGQTAADPTAQQVLSEAVSAVDQMRTTLFRNFDELMTYAQRGESMPIEDRLLYRYQSAQVADVCATHVSRLLKSCGASGLQMSNPITRIFLDCHAGRAHVANYAENNGRNYGGVLCGLENKDAAV